MTVTCDFTMTIDGCMAGPNQRADAPFGDGPGEAMHRWMFEEREANKEAVEGIVGAGAYVMGRNMFSPGRGEWDPDWKGWWGDDPPYHAPVFVLTHHDREPVEMQGGTTYYFVTDGIESAVTQAREAAGDRRVSIAGGASTVRQALVAGLIDELRVHIAPVVTGVGERPFEGVAPLALEQLGAPWGTSLVTHVRYRVSRPAD